jgi:hypothetical protein
MPTTPKNATRKALITEMSKKSVSEPPANGHGNNRVAGVLSAPSTTVSTVEASAGKNGHAANGRSLPGNQAAKGNTVYRKLCAMRRAVLEAVTEEEMAALSRKLYELAIDGDLEAAKLLLLYAVGKPAPAVDPDGADQDEFDRLAARPTCEQVLNTLSDLADPGFAAEDIRRKLPTNLEDFIRRLVDTLKSRIRYLSKVTGEECDD